MSTKKLKPNWIAILFLVFAIVNAVEPLVVSTERYDLLQIVSIVGFAAAGIYFLRRGPDVAEPATKLDLRTK